MCGPCWLLRTTPQISRLRPGRRPRAGVGAYILSSSEFTRGVARELVRGVHARALGVYIRCRDGRAGGGGGVRVYSSLTRQTDQEGGALRVAVAKGLIALHSGHGAGGPLRWQAELGVLHPLSPLPKVGHAGSCGGVRLLFAHPGPVQLEQHGVHRLDGSRLCPG